MSFRLWTPAKLIGAGSARGLLAVWKPSQCQVEAVEEPGDRLRPGRALHSFHVVCLANQSAFRRDEPRSWFRGTRDGFDAAATHRSAPGPSARSQLGQRSALEHRADALGDRQLDPHLVREVAKHRRRREALDDLADLATASSGVRPRAISSPRDDFDRSDASR